MNGLIAGILVGSFAQYVVALVALVFIAAVVLLAVVSLVYQVIVSQLPVGAKIGWVLLALALPVVSLALWYFFAPRDAVTEAEREDADALLALFSEPAEVPPAPEFVKAA